MLTEAELKVFRQKIDEAKRPLIFFDNDPDGLCAFLQVWRYKKEGKGIPCGTRLNPDYLRKVEEYGPDLVVTLDIPVIHEDFISELKVPLLCLDHHPVWEEIPNNVTYLNPKKHDKTYNPPTSYMVYKAFEKDLWIAAIGSISDWYLSDVSNAFAHEYPDLLDAKSASVERALYETEFGKLARIISFNLKGRIAEVMTSVKILCRIDNPYQILKQENSQARYLYRKYEKVQNEYKDFLDYALHTKPKGRLLHFTYDERQFSLTRDLSNELLYRREDKVILVSRPRNDLMLCSMRVNRKLYEKTKKSALDLLTEALKVTTGNGGGHELAVGCNVPIREFDLFLEKLEELANAT